MKKLSIIFLLCFIFNFRIDAQVNLVPNPSFENIVSCDSLWAGALCNNEVLPWNCIGSPDLFNTCASNPQFGCDFNYVGYQIPYSFNGYIGLFTYASATIGANAREVALVRLDSALRLNRKYCVSFYVNLADSSS